jgi:hypothetical protein
MLPHSEALREFSTCQGDRVTKRALILVLSSGAIAAAVIPMPWRTSSRLRSPTGRAGSAPVVELFDEVLFQPLEDQGSG